MLSLNPETIRITFREGLTYEEMKVHLKKSGINFDEPKMDRLVNNPNEFLNYDFVTSIPVGDEREYPLQGYLFPDTYHFDMNTNEKTIVDRMLLNCENKLSDELYERAESIGMSMDEVIILASIIQMESAVPGEMYKVSRVFHNRLDDGERLQSCATVNYIRKGQEKNPRSSFPTPIWKWMTPTIPTSMRSFLRDRSALRGWRRSRPRCILITTIKICIIFVPAVTAPITFQPHWKSTTPRLNVISFPNRTNWSEARLSIRRILAWSRAKHSRRICHLLQPCRPAFRLKNKVFAPRVLAVADQSQFLDEKRDENKSGKTAEVQSS